MNTAPIDITGQRFGRLVAAEQTANKGRDRCWTCDCSCGSRVVVRSAHLRRGLVKSCGCLRAENNPVLRRKHGLSHTAEYYAVNAAFQRCRVASDRRYVDYGGRGIEYRLSEDRGEATRQVIASIGRRPQGHSLDRIDNNSHYEIGNLRWATAEQQQANQRRKAVAA